jgi:purine-binding chemotaxis protein CheW
MEVRQVCTFFLDELFLGVEVDRVQEVLRRQELTPVPLAPPIVRGLLNLRGEIVTAIDLRCRLGLPGLEDRVTPSDSPWPDSYRFAVPQDAERAVNVVLRTDDGAVSLLVDEIGDVLEIEAERLQRPPEAVSEGVRDLVRGVYEFAGQLLLVLDIDKTLAFSAKLQD